MSRDGLHAGNEVLLGRCECPSGTRSPAWSPSRSWATRTAWPISPPSNAALAKLSDISAALSPGDSVHAKNETLFNHAQPFYNAMIIYLVAFLAMLVSWLAWPRVLHRTAVPRSLVLAFSAAQEPRLHPCSLREAVEVHAGARIAIDRDQLPASL